MYGQCLKCGERWGLGTEITCTCTGRTPKREWVRLNNCEAMKPALEALESCKQSRYGRDWVWPDTAHETAMKNVDEAITALRAALSSAAEDAKDAERLEFVLRKLPGNVLRDLVGILSDTSDINEFRAAIDAAREQERK